MLKHAAILAVATASALASAQALASIASARATPVAAAPGDTARQTAGPGAAGSAAYVAKGPDGHYWANANVDGRWMRFLVDTGASAVALTQDDAKRLGIDVAALEYDRPVVTANGKTSAATVNLAHVSVAGARIEDVQAMVVREGLQTSLLGMSYLGRLSRIEATPTAMILRP